MSKPKADLLFVFDSYLEYFTLERFSSSNHLYSVVENSITDNIDFCKKKVLSIPHINDATDKVIFYTKYSFDFLDNILYFV